MIVFNLPDLLEVFYLCLHLPPEIGNAERHVILDPAHPLPPKTHPLQILVVEVLRFLLTLQTRFLHYQHHFLLLFITQSLLLHMQRTLSHRAGHAEVLLMHALTVGAGKTRFCRWVI
jgi:hypothetical protein